MEAPAVAEKEKETTSEKEDDSGWLKELWDRVKNEQENYKEEEWSDIDLFVDFAVNGTFK